MKIHFSSWPIPDDEGMIIMKMIPASSVRDVAKACMPNGHGNPETFLYVQYEENRDRLFTFMPDGRLFFYKPKSQVWEKWSINHEHCQIQNSPAH